MATKYDPETERLMQLHYSRLAEKQKRHYAAIEAQKLGFGGKMYISNLLKINRRTLNKGLLELTDPNVYAQIPQHKQRRTGGGRKKNLPTNCAQSTVDQLH